MRTRSGRGVGGTSNEEVFEQTGTPSRKRNREEDDIEVEDARGSPKRRTNAWAQTSKYALENCKLLELQLDPCWRCKLDKKQCDDKSTCTHCKNSTGPHIRCRLGDLQDDVKNVYPNLPGLGTQEWFLRIIDGTYLRICTEFKEPDIEICDMDILAASSGPLIAFLRQFHELGRRWRNQYEQVTEGFIALCASIQENIIQTCCRTNRPLSEDNLLIALVLRALTTSHIITDPCSYLIPEDAHDFFDGEYLMTPEIVEDNEDFRIEVSRCKLPKPPAEKDTRQLSPMIQQIVGICQRLIVRGRPSDWPSLFCALCLIQLVHSDCEVDLSYIPNFEGEGKLYTAWETLCDMFEVCTKGRHPLVDDWHPHEYQALVGLRNPVVALFDLLNSAWVDADHQVLGAHDRLSDRIPRYIYGEY